ncbi:hypothetical protein RND71_023469 [Anisodus tanguticus]|uniref:Pectin acetylesterase n=1 Tax=Anisodus tanguticus TaxID=243964 RepID=A0AAE1RV77_9SOLA|nr:hypothetical protein RND71_023469 [Anisodus tanguticus]
MLDEGVPQPAQQRPAIKDDKCLEVANKSTSKFVSISIIRGIRGILIYEGGEWCYNVTNCLERTNTEKDSSKLALKQRSFYGILSNNKTVNPGHSHRWFSWRTAWNRALLPNSARVKCLADEGIKTRFFIVNSMFDTFQRRCSSPPACIEKVFDQFAVWFNNCVSFTYNLLTQSYHNYKAFKRLDLHADRVRSVRELWNFKYKTS